MNIQTNYSSVKASPEIEAMAKSLPSFDDVELDIHWFVRNDSPNILRISGEFDEDDSFIIDYYSTGKIVVISPDMRTMSLVQKYEPGPYIHKKLVEWATANNGYWEWENPSNIAFYRL